ncbi:YqgE/AlgH family protein [Corynebacterium sp. TAE3-ERU12]|uniref:YqgE/AlgH family protein n=1 Tax=Corynebacterium sp. TAE3-ERU12 TaxID=2849491 RepID=UPI001C476394|nr:YqgE/AlgH family protein [Corynebacterium sp. TAE3-ERU12]MBV7294329.1 YqgE/AlgH family protein [Corynebacterium sp. TAE3-ERU12]
MSGERLFDNLERITPEAGMLLVAAPNMRSGEFARSVIFIIEHDEAGTLGVDLTTRSETPVHNVLPEWADMMVKPPVVYVGGPVNQTQPICLGVVANGAELPTMPVAELGGAPLMQPLASRFAIINLAAEPEQLSGLFTGARLFAGYAGWGAGQLDDEIQAGDWFVAPALPSDLLAPALADVWGDVMRRQDWPLPLYATFPSNTADN